MGVLDDWQFSSLRALQHAALANQMGADAALEYLDDIVIRSKPEEVGKAREYRHCSYSSGIDLKDIWWKDFLL